MEMKRPGGELASRPLHFIWIADSSGSMGDDGKIQSLNTAIREAVPHMKKVAEDNPNAQVLVRAVKFSNGAQWHISQPTPVADFAWADLTADGETDMGKGLELVAEQLKMPPMSDRALPPVLVLLSVLFLLATAAIVVLLGVPYAIETMRETQRTEPRRLPQ